jgi:MFS family permease
MMSDSMVSARQQWRTATLLTSIYALSMADRQILSLLVSPLRADLKLSDTQIGLLAGPAFVILHVAMLLPCGRIVDYWNRRNLVAFGAIFWSIMAAGCGLASSFWTIATARAGVGIGEATVTPAAYSIIADTFPRAQLSRGLSFYALGLPIGTTLTLMGGGWLIGYLDSIGPIAVPLLGALKPWQAVFVIVALPGIPLALLLRFFVSEPRRHTQGQSDKPPSVRSVLSYIWQHRAIYTAVFFGGGLLAVFGYGANYWLPTILQRVHGFSIKQSGMFIGLAIFLLGMPGTLFAGWLADRLVARGSADGPLLVGIFYAFAVLVCAGFGPLVGPEWLSLSMIAGGMFFLNIWGACVAPAILQQVTPSRMRGRVSAIYVLLSNLIGLGLGPPMVALATDHVFSGHSAVGGSLALVGTISVLASTACMQLGRAALRRFDFAGQSASLT